MSPASVERFFSDIFLSFLNSAAPRDDENRTVIATAARLSPKIVDRATLFSYVGEMPPAPDDLGKWKFERVTSKTVVDVRPGNPYAGLPPGTRVWIIAFRTNRRGQRGPTCEPVNAHTQYGIEIGSLPLLRMAA